METYYYLRGRLGLTPSGSGSGDKKRWMTFTQNEKDLITASGKRPYGAKFSGTFKPTDQH